MDKDTYDAYNEDYWEQRKKSDALERRRIAAADTRREVYYEKKREGLYGQPVIASSSLFVEVEG